MPVPRLTLRDAPAAAGVPTRADVALFTGLVARGANPLPDALRAALEAAGWAGAGPFARPPQQVDALLDVPVAVESWSAFEALYAWNARPADAAGGATAPCALGVAVKSFFEEGGAKAWIVRTGDPLPLVTPQTPAENRKRLISLDAPQPADHGTRVPIVPGWKGAAAPGDARAPATWHGYEHVFGLDDVAFLLLPDLPELLALPADPLAPAPAPPPVPEQWKTCAPALPGVLPDARPTPPPTQAPRLARAGYGDWSEIVAFVLDRLDAAGSSAHRRDVMLIASLPLPSMQPDAVPARSQAWPLALLSEPGNGVARQALLDSIPGARVQFVYPWVQTQASLGLPEGLQAPEGVFAGVLARNSLGIGTFRAAAGQPCFSVRRLAPELGTADIERGLPGAAASWLGDRLSLLGERAGRFVLLSDATFAANLGWRAGGTSRLMGVIIRAARWLGEQRLFDVSGPALWASVRRDFEALLDDLRAAGALDGARPADAYEVRCDTSTMSQQDIDAGRLIVRISVNPAQSVGWITVTLAVGGVADAVREAA
ncbi:Phage tail sheath protein [Caballeronia arationis]|uniref:hypothetical protein n=1 Tax=Caballeronia arationis TaxID=1777142 RepID=UPI00074BEF56|nr:hypothetical protein [Caballeronia arationis]SAK96356.1 Phage tail sheath protein [Caballeronia arationis]